MFTHVQCETKTPTPEGTSKEESGTKKVRFIVALIPPVFRDKRHSEYQITKRYATNEIYKMQLANK